MRGEIAPLDHAGKASKLHCILAETITTATAPICLGPQSHSIASRLPENCRVVDKGWAPLPTSKSSAGGGGALMAAGAVEAEHVLHVGVVLQDLLLAHDLHGVITQAIVGTAHPERPAGPAAEF